MKHRERSFMSFPLIVYPKEAYKLRESFEEKNCILWLKSYTGLSKMYFKTPYYPLYDAIC